MVLEELKTIKISRALQIGIAEFFRAALIMGALAVVVEVVRPGTVSYFVNPLIILLVVVGSALLTIWLGPSTRDTKEAESDIWFMGVLAVAAGVIMGWSLRDFSWLAWLLGIITTVMIVVIALTLDDNEQNEL